MSTGMAIDRDRNVPRPALAARVTRQVSILSFVSVILVKAVAFQVLDVMSGHARIRRQKRRAAVAFEP